MPRPEILFPLFTPITRLKGAGPATSEQLHKLLKPGQELPIVRDLLFHLPTNIVDRRKDYPLLAVPAGAVGTFRVKVERHFAPTGRSYKGARRPYKVLCTNNTGDLMLVFFHVHGDYLSKQLPVGQERIVSGTVEHFDGHVQMTHPEIIARVEDEASVRRVEPVYPLTAGLTGKKLGQLIREAMGKLPQLPEWLEEERKTRHGWPGWNEALEKLHAPTGTEDIHEHAPARDRMAYDELLANQLHLARLRQKTQRKAGQVLPVSKVLREKLRAALPFKLTSAQQRVITEIDADLQSGHRMARLVQGDVGSGKTVVALMAALSAAEAGFQTAFMAPTELVAEQHAATLRKWCEKLGVEVCLLTGSIKGKAREAALRQIENGTAHIIVGTHALFQDAVDFKALALVVVDEQHRFGVAQRMAIAGKGDAPHLLQLTATPIPRSLAMTLFGDMDISLLDEKPAGRQDITTRVIPNSRLDEVIKAAGGALKRGEKIYWICPQIEEGAQAKDDVAAAEARYIQFKTQFGEQQVGLIHGRIKSNERDAVMQRFASGEVRLLVATTVVEVGVDVPDATIMVIEQAERFGLAQLHQLRGRVGRSDKSSSCVLLHSEPISAEGQARLATLRESNDGFFIAEQDLRLRGAGDLLSTRQSGLPHYHFADLFLHQDLLLEARANAAEILKQDSSLDQSPSLRVLLALYGYE